MTPSFRIHALLATEPAGNASLGLCCTLLDLGSTLLDGLVKLVNSCAHLLASLFPVLVQVLLCILAVGFKFGIDLVARGLGLVDLDMYKQRSIAVVVIV